MLLANVDGMVLDLYIEKINYLITLYCDFRTINKRFLSIVHRADIRGTRRSLGDKQRVCCSRQQLEVSNYLHFYLNLPCTTRLLNALFY